MNKDNDLYKKYVIAKAVVVIGILWLVIIFVIYSFHLFRRYIAAVELKNRYEVVSRDCGDYIIDKAEKTKYIFEPDSMKFVLMK